MIKLVRRILASLGICGIGILVSAIVFFTLRSLEIKNAQASFDAVAQERLDALQTNVTLTVNHLISLGAFYDAALSVQRAEFDRFTAVLLERNHAIQALEWIPRVTKQSRAQYEEAARHDGFASFCLTERISGRMVPAEEREQYFPVFFVAPLKGNEKALGYDLASDPVRREALYQSADSGALVATSRIKLVQETADQYGFLVYRPTYRAGVQPTSIEARRASLMGFVLAVFRIGDIAKGTGAVPNSESNLTLAIFDRDAKAGERLLYPKGAHLDGMRDLPPGFRAARTISVAGRTWELAVYPMPNSFRPARWSSWIMFLTGLLLTAALTAYLVERKRAEQAFATSEERYRSLICNIPDVVWTADAVGRFAYISPNIERLSGFSTSEIYQQGAKLFLSRIHPDDVQKVKQGFQALLGKGQAFDVECRIRRKTGEWIWIRDRALTTYPRGGVCCADGIFSDITGRKRVEESLRMQYKTARALVECHTLDEAAPSILQSICEVLGWDCGILWGIEASRRPDERLFSAPFLSSRHRYFPSAFKRRTKSSCAVRPLLA